MSTNKMLLNVVEQVKKAIIGKDEAIKLSMAAILAGGHILLEDVPGVGKTTLAVAFSKAMNLEGKRMQFTPDVMPSDLTGFSVYNKQSGKLEYKAGALMCNIFLGDEINRTSPKTQSALLEAMEEGSITVDGKTHFLRQPFIVIATQNPIGSAGTQPLPESQLDRFMIKLSMGYPDSKSELEVLKNGGSISLSEIDAVMDEKQLNKLRDETSKVHTDDKILEYIIKLTTATREDEKIRLGLSPRGSLSLTALSKAYAMLEGRDYVIPEDVQKVFPYAACHRIVLEPRAKIEGITAHDAILEIIERVGKADLL